MLGAPQVPFRPSELVCKGGTWKGVPVSPITVHLFLSFTDPVLRDDPPIGDCSITLKLE